MGDTKKHKYKGKICSPPAATTAATKDTKHWCKGKPGRAHVPGLFYNTKPDQNWGLATQVEERCEACDKRLRSYWELPHPTHDFGVVVHAIERAHGVNLPGSELDNMVIQKLVAPTLDYMSRIADLLGVRLVIELHEKGKHRTWGRHVRVTTGQEPEID